MTRAESWLLLAPVVACVACGAGQLAIVPDDPEHRAEGPSHVAASITAHGGMAAWQAIGGVRFHLRTEGPLGGYPPDSDWLVDPLRNRGVARWTEAGKPREVRFDGENAILVEDGRCLDARRDAEAAASRMRALLFWFGVPWKFVDQGASVRGVAPLALRRGDPPALRYVVRFSVGKTPLDWFLVWLDATTRRVARIDYLASEVSRSRVQEVVAERYAEVEGLSILARRAHRPRGTTASPFVQELTALAIHQPLRDDLFAPPVSCLPPPEPPPAEAPPPPPPRRRTAVDVSADEVIDAGRERVFAVATDPTLAPRWQDPDSSIEWRSDPPLARGATLVFRTEILGRKIAFTVEVVERVNGRRLVLRSVGMPSSLEIRYEWEDAGPAQTRVRLKVRGQVVVPRIAAPFVATALRRALRANLDRLKDLVEATPAE